MRERAVVAADAAPEAGAASVMQMTDRDRERVGGIVRRRRRVEAQQQPDHLLHLRLLGAAVADTASLISPGVYSATGRPACTAASTATPRAWPSVSALRTLRA